MVQTVVFICLGYLSGSVLYARVFAALFQKGDILQQSRDHNPGTANAFLYGGFWCGLLTLFFDLFKGFMPVYLFTHYGPAGAVAPFWAALAVAAPVLGHIFPLFYRFRGGKGIAVTFGCLAGLYPAWQPLLILAFFFLLFSTVLKVSPHFYRTIFSYVGALAAILWEMGSETAALGFLWITAAVLVRLLTSGERRERLEVKLVGRFDLLPRDRRRT